MDTRLTAIGKKLRTAAPSAPPPVATQGPIDPNVPQPTAVAQSGLSGISSKLKLPAKRGY